jgi:hypothetical protein
MIFQDLSKTKSKHDEDTKEQHYAIQLKGLRVNFLSASAYLEEILSSLQCVSNTLVVQTSFKFKEILNYQKRIKAERRKQSMDINGPSSTFALDPTSTEFPAQVVFNIFPSLDPRGVQFMQFPVVMKYVCIAHENHLLVLREMMDTVIHIDRDLVYLRAEYNNSLIFKKLMDKLWRAAFLRDSEITGVLWDQGTGIYIYICMYSIPSFLSNIHRNRAIMGNAANVCGTCKIFVG